jgi:hypothetical protein
MGNEGISIRVAGRHRFVIGSNIEAAIDGVVARSRTAAIADWKSCGHQPVCDSMGSVGRFSRLDRLKAECAS